MANMIEFKLSKKQVNKLAMENIYLRDMGEVMHAEKMYLAAQLRDSENERERLRTALAQYADLENWGVRCLRISIHGWDIAEAALAWQGDK